ncbi:helix-turn-helix transcriptional regulator [Agrococcus sp. 1P02AA]|uniref:helix-turn-helix domain-containing protein n=1 Tax=Agrococcus sp. 1P02AA TaxID=3132259 RepID=UPI0039A6506F
MSDFPRPPWSRDDRIHLASKVQGLRLRRGMSQIELAGAADVTPATIKHIESGMAPRPLTLKLVLVALDVPVGA